MTKYTGLLLFLLTGSVCFAAYLEYQGYEKIVHTEENVKSLPVYPREEVVNKYRSKLHSNLNCTVKSNIPCFFWMTTKSVHNFLETYSWISQFVELNPDWNFRIADDAEMLAFMEAVFGGTKIFWAFNQINERLMPSRTDIWRYCILWVYGGGYMDTDANIRRRLSTIVNESLNADFIFGSERSHKHECYKDSFHLNQKKLPVNSPYDFGTHVFAQNIFMSAPGHPFLRRCLENLVEIIEMAYFGNSPIVGVRETRLNQEVICGTGPLLFTYSIIEEFSDLILKNSTKFLLFYNAGIHFTLFDANAKMIKNRDNPGHYYKVVFDRRSDETFLKNYHNTQAVNISQLA